MVEALARAMVLGALLEKLTNEHGGYELLALLVDDARSELLPEHRARVRGGGWCAR